MTGAHLRTSRDATKRVTEGLVSVVILNWNSGPLLQRAVQSVRAQAYSPFELIVVDNGSSDDSRRAVLSLPSDVIVLPQDSNLGFACGMNIGWGAASGEFFLPMNCDAVLHPQFLARAVEFFRSHPKVGILAPLVVRISPEAKKACWDEQGPWVLDGAVLGLRSDMRVFLAAGDEDGRDTQTFKANGSCPILREALIDSICEEFDHGPFDPMFDTYGEDVDQAFKCWALGWTIRFVPGLVAGHVRSYASAQSVRAKRGRMRVNLLASRYLNALRHVPPARLPFSILGIAAGDAALVATQFARGDSSVLSDSWQAWSRVARAFSGSIRFRRAHCTWRRMAYSKVVRPHPRRRDSIVTTLGARPRLDEVRHH